MTNPRYPGVTKTGAHTWGYVVSEYDPVTGKRRQPRRGGFPSAEAARDARAEHMARISRGHITPGTITVKQVVEDFIVLTRLRRRKPSTLKAYRDRADLYVLPGLGPHRLSQLRSATVAEWVHGMQSRGLAPGTIGAAHRLLVAAISQAMRDRLVDHNAAAHIELPREQRERPDIWTDTEIRAFLSVADRDEHRALWRLSLLMQLRPGEAAALMWSDVDFKRGTLSINRTRTRDEAGREVIGTSPKNDSSRATLPLPAECVTLLREHQQSQREYKLRYPGPWDNGGLIFTARDGRRLSSKTVSHWLHRLCDEAKVRYLSPHHMRHSGATWLLSQGVSVAVISRRLRHTSISTTEDMYLGDLDEAQEGVSQRLDEAFGRHRESGAS